MRTSRRIAGILVLGAMVTLLGLQAIPASAVHGDDTEVTVGSNDNVFSQNKQNEPAVAIDPARPWLVAAGANDNIDMEACNAGPDTDCPFTTDVGGSGIQFSFSSGDSWVQPTYSGLTARDCLGVVGDTDPPCVAHPGPIGTLPHYDDAGMVSDGDPAVVFGPIPDASGEFSWDNGSRLYYANLAAATTVTETPPFRGFEAIAVSRMDVPASVDTAGEAASVVSSESSWADPVVVSKQSATTFSDKEQIWVDQDEDSPFFGNAYVCWASFRSLSSGNALPTPLRVATSTDGGETWTDRQVTDATNNPFNPKKGFGRSGCTIRTDTDGVVYVFANQFAVGTPGEGAHIMIRSFDGGRRWTRPLELFTAVDACFAIQFDGAGFRCVMDGVAGARDDLSSSPSLDIALDTGFLYDVWADGRSGSAGPPVDNTTQLRLAFAHADDAGSPAAWTQMQIPVAAGDRPYYAAIALSPDGTDAYLVYNAFTNPYRNDTTSSRGLVGVVLHADVDPTTGVPGAFTEVHRGPTGDPRASAQNNLVLEFLGDYVYADATNDYGVAVWQDTRQGAVCPAIQAWRATVQATLTLSTPPAVQQACPATFGNSDIWAWSGADPS
ncbi:MAG TPA: sialidase family protein [Actinomycetota bacterium]|nr:sialidase family protein [Actinomycetota bacterium]